jgi:hypothetical protein
MKKKIFSISMKERLIIIYRNRKRSGVTASALPGIHVKSGAYIKAVGSAIENIAGIFRKIGKRHTRSRRACNGNRRG